MISISLCMIVKNEENTLPKCLESIKGLVDEIVIVDTGSTDKTKKAAKKYTNKIFDFQWTDDFSAARNFAFSKATKDYILWLDADDVFLPEDYHKFKALKGTLDESIDGVMMLYNIAFDSAGRPTFSYYRERLVKRSRNFQWNEPVHEYISTPGAHTINAEIAVTHAKQDGENSAGRNIRIYEARIQEGQPMSPRALYYYARELRDNARYADAIVYFKKFLDTKLGWVEDNIGACIAMSDSHAALNQPEESLLALLSSFQYDLPRAEVCVRIGYHFKNRDQIKLAIHWFETVMRLEYPKESWGFLQKDFWGYIPCLELCVCYDLLGNREKSIEYNEKAAEYKPDSAAVRYNREYFGIPVS